jgi:cobalt/nickel transport system permease protein
MHIPDGYLSPQTEMVFGAAMLPVWYTATKKVRKVVKSKEVPLLAICAAFAFLIMMFNVPIPDGTTAHAVGAVLIAILLGPWAATIAISIALATQALFFGDGGVLAFGANCFNMGFVMPFVGYGIYQVMTRNMSLTTPRRAFAAGLSGYLGLNAAALCASIELGLQPVLFHTANGTPLYSPYHLAQSVPAMMLAHSTVAGFVEFAITAGVVAYLQRANLPLLRINAPNVPVTDEELEHRRLPGWSWAFIGIAVMIALTPIGLLAPGGAFGEDAPTALPLSKLGLRAVPEGLQRFSGFWSHALLGGYGFHSGDHPVIGYYISAVAGILIIAGIIFGIVWIGRLIMRSRSGAATPDKMDVAT